MQFNFDCGNYRGFVVTADNKKQAIERFTAAAQHGATHGFTMKDVTKISVASPLQLLQAAMSKAQGAK